MKIILILILLFSINCVQPIDNKVRKNLFDTNKPLGILLTQSLQASSKINYIRNFKINDLTIISSYPNITISWTEPKYGLTAKVQLGISTQPITSFCSSNVQGNSFSINYSNNSQITLNTGNTIVDYSTNICATDNNGNPLNNYYSYPCQNNTYYFCVNTQVYEGSTLLSTNPWNGSTLGVQYK